MAFSHESKAQANSQRQLCTDWVYCGHSHLRILIKVVKGGNNSCFPTVTNAFSERGTRLTLRVILSDRATSTFLEKQLRVQLLAFGICPEEVAQEQLDSTRNLPSSYAFLCNPPAQAPCSSLATPATLQIGCLQLQRKASPCQLLFHGSQLPPAAECDHLCNSIWRHLLGVFCCGGSWELNSLGEFIMKGSSGGQICSFVFPFSLLQCEVLWKCILHNLLL